jgi:hypothetical protein
MVTQAKGKHLSTGSEYPDSPCGFTDRLVYRVEEVTCPECKRILIKSAKQTLALLEKEPSDE